MIIGPAAVEDFEAIGDKLAAARLPIVDLSPESLSNFLIATVDDQIVGAIGLEVHSEDALLRSLVVLPAHRSHGVGIDLLNSVEALARTKGIAALTLLTTTAAAFFERAGYAVIERGTVAARLRKSAEFSKLCPSSAICMRKSLA